MPTWSDLLVVVALLRTSALLFFDFPSLIYWFLLVSHVPQVVDANRILAKIKYDVLMKRIRVTEFFRDFDKLRTGCISRPQFRQGLCAMGQGLSDDEFAALASKYRPVSKPDMIAHAKFSSDIDTVFHGELKYEALESGGSSDILEGARCTELEPKQEQLTFLHPSSRP